MMKLKEFNVISDTHHLADEQLESLIPVFNSGELLVHLGDGVSDLKKIESRLTCPIIKIRGNNDIFSDASGEAIIETQHGKILFTHGHECRVKSSLMSLYYNALEKGCKYAFYGHTHASDVNVDYGVTMINPGSLAGSWRSKGSYCSVYEDGNQYAIKIVLI